MPAEVGFVLSCTVGGPPRFCDPHNHKGRVWDHLLQSPSPSSAVLTNNQSMIQWLMVSQHFYVTGGHPTFSFYFIRNSLGRQSIPLCSKICILKISIPCPYLSPLRPCRTSQVPVFHNNPYRHKKKWLRSGSSLNPKLSSPTSWRCSSYVMNSTKKILVLTLFRTQSSLSTSHRKRSFTTPIGQEPASLHCGLHTHVHGGVVFLVALFVCFGGDSFLNSCSD